jgi:hypothetical protein
MIAKLKNAFWGAHDYVVGAYFVAAFIVKRHIAERKRKVGGL